MNRIIVIGPSGAGKSIFSEKLQKVLNIPLYHLDIIFWNEDKTHISKEAFDNNLKEILKGDKWIIDGDYSRTYEMRMDACDTIIFLNYSLEVCLKGAESRIGKKRKDLPWIENEFDPEFREWIINWFKNNLDNVKSLLERYKNNKDVIIFNNRDEANSYLESLVMNISMES